MRRRDKEDEHDEEKHVLAIGAGIVGTVAVVQLVAAGLLGGIGPLGFLQKRKMKKKEGNADVYDFDKIVPLEDSPLKGKNVCILGSSVVFGAASLENAVGEYLAARTGCNLTKEAVSGTTLTDIGKNSYVQRLVRKIDASENFDLFICQLSTNDASRKLPLGEISPGDNPLDFDTKTVTGAMEYIISYAQRTWHCPVVFFTGSYYESPQYAAMVERLKELQKKWGIGILNLWDDKEFNTLTDAQRKLYMNDGVHPTKAGYSRWWGPEQERQLLEFLNEK